MRFFCLTSVFIISLSSTFGDLCERNGARCLDYEIIQAHEDYEERRYPSIVWVSTSDEAKTKSEVSRKLIKKLYSYLGGENSKGEKLDMVVPVRTAKIPLGSFNRYTMAIALKAEQSENPPLPSDPNVVVIREPVTTYITKSFGGQVRQESIWDEHAKALQISAKKGNPVNETFYYMCVYDSPWRETDRLNEVWMLKKT